MVEGVKDGAGRPIDLPDLFEGFFTDFELLGVWQVVGLFVHVKVDKVGTADGSELADDRPSTILRHGDLEQVHVLRPIACARLNENIQIDSFYLEIDILIL